MPQNITSKQCRQSRSLLKWNVPDLANKSGLMADRIDKFERNIVRLTAIEAKELIKTLEDSGIEFKADFEVKLKKIKSSGGGNFHTYTVNSDMSSRVTDQEGREVKEDDDED